MKIRHAKPNELPRLMELYDAARAFMRRCGNTVQWVGGYPSREMIAASIAAGEQFVCVAESRGELSRDGLGGDGSSRDNFSGGGFSRGGLSGDDLSRDGFGGDGSSRDDFRSDDFSGDGFSGDGDRIVATFWFAVKPEPTYAQISEGSGWLNEAPYGVVHRLASDGSVRGVGAFCLEWSFAQCGNIRVDTHADNAVMQSLLTRLNYTRCGTIHIADGTPRDAFHKTSHKTSP